MTPRFFVAHAPWAPADDPEVWCVYEDRADGEEPLGIAAYETEAEANAEADRLNKEDAEDENR